VAVGFATLLWRLKMTAKKAKPLILADFLKPQVAALPYNHE
jgi:hypothetical protein